MFQNQSHFLQGVKYLFYKIKVCYLLLLQGLFFFSYKSLYQKKNFEELKAVSYSNELKSEIAEVHKKYNITSHQKMKSSLKFCVVAAGEFDLYAAEPRACEWDIAAGHAILEHAGGKITDFNGDEILYGKPEFKNPSLIIRNKNIL